MVSKKKINGWAAVALVFLVCAVVYGLLSSYPRELAVYSDELRYLDVARSLLQGRGLRVRNMPSDYQKILYPLCILPALLLRTTAAQITAIGWLNAVYMASAVFPAYALARAMRLNPRRTAFLVGVTAALLADEAALLLGMACTGQWNWSYLPLHLCSINVFVCLYNTLTDRSWCKEELYALCIPGAALALLCPSWRDVPGWFTLINLHSVSIHALLVLYPVLLVAGGYRPSVRRVPQVLAFLFGSALPIYFLNKPLHTNFYFLNNPYGNVITSTFTAWFGEKFYILGFLPAIALALALMYAPWVVGKRKKI